MGISLKESKEIQLGILKYLKEICEQNGLKYYLAYGTLLGAVRHHGFIPWDDDIDVMMPREDYEKLLLLLKNNSHPYYKLLSFESEALYTFPFPKIIDTRTRLVQNYGLREKVELGVYIDIFLLDGAGDTAEEGEKMRNEAFVCLQNWYRSSMKMFRPQDSKIIGFLKWIKNTGYRAKGMRHYLSVMKAHNSQYSYYESTYVGMLDYNIYVNQGNIWKRNWFGEGTEIEFENTMFRVPEKYDEILTDIYGDYMQLPPVEKRVSNHDYEVYWKDSKNKKQ